MRMEVNLGYNSTSVNTVLLTLQSTEDDNQEQITEEYNLEISVPKTNVMAFQEKYPIRSKRMVCRESTQFY